MRKVGRRGRALVVGSGGGVDHARSVSDDERIEFLTHAAAALAVIAALSGMIGVATLTIAWLTASSGPLRALAAAPLVLAGVLAVTATVTRSRLRRTHSRAPRRFRAFLARLSVRQDGPST